MSVIGRNSLKEKDSTIMWKTFKRFKPFATRKFSFGKVDLIRSAAILICIVACIAFRVAKEQRTRVTWPNFGAEFAVQQNLGRAESQINANLDAEMAAVKAFFAAARQRTPGYAETVLGWKSKWKLTADFVMGRQEHAAFLQQQFAELIFSNQELDQLVEQTVSGFLRETDDIEAQTLVTLQADLEHLPAGSLPPAVDVNQIRTVLNDALHQAAQSARTELGATVGRELGSYVAGEVLACAATQLATSAGILTAGAGSSWATAGIGIVIGVIVDQIVSRLYDWTVNPVGKLTEMLNAQLDQLESLILQGNAASPGLRDRLLNYTTQRNAARRQAIQHAIHP